MKYKYFIILFLTVCCFMPNGIQCEIIAVGKAEILASDDTPKYLPMYENGRKWVWRRYKSSDPNTTISIKEETVVGDTIINNVSCKKIFNPEYLGVDYGYDKDGIVFGYYGDFLPIYRFDIEEKKDTLRYLYSEMTVSDRGEEPHAELKRKMNFKVDSICVNNVIRKRISFTWDNGNKERSCWIEGIGAFGSYGAEMLVQLPTHACDYESLEEELIACYDGEECIFTEEDALAPSITDKSIHGIKRKILRCPKDIEITDTNVVKFVYDEKLLSVELKTWKHLCATTMWPRAFVDNTVIRIIPDIVNYSDDEIFTEYSDYYVDKTSYDDFYFSFPGIEPGRYTVMLMSDDGKEVQSTYELDLTDGFSKQFPDDPSYDGAIEISNDVDITFDGTLVEFGSDGSAMLELFTTEGVRLARTEGSGTVRLSTGELMPGIYVVRATTADGRPARRKIAVK